MGLCLCDAWHIGSSRRWGSVLAVTLEVCLHSLSQTSTARSACCRRQIRAKARRFLSPKSGLIWLQWAFMPKGSAALQTIASCVWSWSCISPFLQTGDTLLPAEALWCPYFRLCWASWFITGSSVSTGVGVGLSHPLLCLQGQTQLLVRSRCSVNISRTPLLVWSLQYVG